MHSGLILLIRVQLCCINTIVFYCSSASTHTESWESITEVLMPYVCVSLYIKIQALYTYTLCRRAGFLLRATWSAEGSSQNKTIMTSPLKSWRPLCCLVFKLTAAFRTFHPSSRIGVGAAAQAASASFIRFGEKELMGCKLILSKSSSAGRETVWGSDGETCKWRNRTDGARSRSSDDPSLPQHSPGKVVH